METKGERREKRRKNSRKMRVSGRSYLKMLNELLWRKGGKSGK